MNRDALIDFLSTDPDVADGSAEALAGRILALDAPSKRTPILALEERDHDRVARIFERRTARQGDCIVWTGPLNGNGYGMVMIYENGYPRNTSAHRASWLLVRGPIPNRSLVLDHLCRNRACVRVEHLELVTNRENVRRGKSTKTHCKNGHPLEGETLRMYRNPRTGVVSRVCITCARANSRAYHANRRAASAATKKGRALDLNQHAPEIRKQAVS